ncbi:hypothetical protein OUZ56_029909 [Daphnia magna]|uniref:Uncharacterized protein n=1 Tax=Daphnia magna TaxID=35525 RepID=A0ABR0B846_9CRUS|nr:hypothetical protein OUZ56_029909 [Daphnia magna]
MQWNQVSHSHKPIEVYEAMCHRIRDSRQCRGKAMDIIGSNTFALEGYPFFETTWLQTTTEKMTNCRLEEVTLQTECPNCTISSPVGDIPGAPSGSFKHNLFTLVWEDTWKESKPCELRIIEKGFSVKYSTVNKTIFRIRDPAKQLTFIFLMENSSVCGNISQAAFHPVLGMDKVVIAVRETTKEVDRPDGKSNQTDATVGLALSMLTRSEIEYASHIQYIRDFAMKISNHLAREIRNLQCECHRAAYHAATTTAKSEGLANFKYEFGERPHPLQPTPSRPYQPLPAGVTIDEKLAFYETGFYGVAIRYLPRPDAVAVTDLQVNADYARYLESLRPNLQKQPKSLHPARYSESPPQQVCPKNKVKVAIEDHATGQMVTAKKEEEEGEFVLQVLETRF